MTFLNRKLHKDKLTFSQYFEYQNRDLTKQTFLWLVNMSDHRLKIILGPGNLEGTFR